MLRKPTIFLVLSLLIIIISRLTIKLDSFPDESEYFLSSCLMSHGKIIYKDFFTHHFPIPYYILSSIYSISGCKIFLPRYLIFSLFYLCFLIAFFTVKSKKQLMIFPIYILISPFFKGFYYISEVFTNLGLIIILFLYFNWSKHIKIREALLLFGNFILTAGNQIGIIFSFIFAFLFFKNKKISLFTVSIIFLFPFFLTNLIMFLNGNIKDFFNNVIIFNFQIYSKYAEINSNIKSLLLIPWILIKQEIFLNDNYYMVVFWIYILISFIYYFVFVKDKNKIIFILLVVASLGRYTGLFTQDKFRLLSLIIILIFINNTFIPQVVKKNIYRTLTIFLLITLSINYAIYYINQSKKSHDYWYWKYFDPIVREKTKPGDKVLFFPLYPSSYLTNNRFPGSYYSYLLPWVSDIKGSENRIISEIKTNNIKLIVYNNNMIIHGYKLQEYSKKLAEFIKENFTAVDKGKTIFIKKK